MEALEDPRRLVLGDADAAVAHPQHRLPTLRGQRHLDAALEGELEGVGDQVEDDLLPHLAVHEDRLDERRRVDGEREAGLLAGGSEAAGEVAGEGGKVGRLVDGLNAAGLDAREVEQCVDQPLQAKAVALRELDPLALAAVQRLARLRERVLQRAQHQRQRRAELVADVGEEGGLGPVDRRQRLGPLAGLLVGSGVADRGGDLGGRQIEERAIVVIEPQPRADAGDEETDEALRDHHRHDHRFARRIAPRPGRQPRKALAEVVHHELARLGDDVRERPGRRVRSQLYHVRGHRIAGLGARSARQPRLPAVRFQQVDQCERRVVGVGADRFGHPLARRLGGARLAGARAEVAQGREAALANDLLGDLADGRQHAADAAGRVGVGRGAVGEGEVGFLVEAAPAQLELDVIGPAGWAAAERGVDQRLQPVGHLGPHLAERPPQRPRMLLAQHRAVGVVVDRDVVGTPPQQLREAVGQDQADDGLQRRRPGLHRAERRRAPVLGADQGAHLARAFEKDQVRRLGNLYTQPSPPDGQPARPALGANLRALARMTNAAVAAGFQRGCQ